MADNTKDYELKIAITENGSRVQTINTKDNLSLELIVDWIAWHINEIKKVIDEQLQQL